MKWKGSAVIEVKYIDLVLICNFLRTQFYCLKCGLQCKAYMYVDWVPSVSSLYGRTFLLKSW